MQRSRSLALFSLSLSLSLSHQLLALYAYPLLNSNHSFSFAATFLHTLHLFLAHRSYHHHHLTKLFEPCISIVAIVRHFDFLDYLSKVK
jgi:hypothetical protein